MQLEPSGSSAWCLIWTYFPGLNTTQAGAALVAEFHGQNSWLRCFLCDALCTDLHCCYSLIKQAEISEINILSFKPYGLEGINTSWCSLGSHFWFKFPLTCTADHRVPCYIHAFIFYGNAEFCICSCWNSFCWFPFNLPSSQDPLNLKLIFYLSLLCWSLTK